MKHLERTFATALHLCRCFKNDIFFIFGFYDALGGIDGMSSTGY